MTGRALVLACLALSGCVAETVERRRPRKGPVPEVGYVDPGGGRTRYSLEGWDWFVALRRRHSLRLMRKNCGRHHEPRIVDEFARDDAEAAYAGEEVTRTLLHGGEHFNVEKFMHQVYECRPKEPPR